MAIFLCTACGISFPDAPAPPDRCPICDEERQFIPAGGQGWTTLPALIRTHRNEWQLLEDGLLSLHTQPHFAIGQRALLLQTPAGNVLWDCISLLDKATETLIRALGGLAAIAISHPHYYTTVQDWADAFGAPVYLHAADREWVTRPHAAIQFWEEETRQILPGVTLLRLGGHFAGGTVLHSDRGILLSGDILQVTPGRDRVSFLWSYPNMMPLPAHTVREMTEKLLPLRYDRLYGAFPGRDIHADAMGIVARSAERYIELLTS